MTTPAPVAPPTEEAVEAYRVAVLAYRASFKAELERWGKGMSYHIPNHAAAKAGHELRPELSYEQAYALAQQGANWAAQAHWRWFWKGVR